MHLPPGAKSALARWIWLRQQTLGVQESVQETSEKGKRDEENAASTRGTSSNTYKEGETTVSASQRADLSSSHQRMPLFVPILKSRNPTGGHMMPRRLTDESVLHILTQRAKAAGLKKTSPHDFRRNFISDLLEAGADIATVQKMAGHANVTTTARYDRRDEKTRKKAAHLLYVPID